MSEDVKPEKKPKPEKGLTRVKIWVDGVWSSIGEHRKGEVVDIPEEDAKVLIEKEFAQEC